MGRGLGETPRGIVLDMARGWESKNIEAQQADREASTSRAAPLGPEEAAAAARRRTLELALARAVGDLATASNPAHRQMLQAAIQALEEQLRG